MRLLICCRVVIGIVNKIGDIGSMTYLGGGGELEIDRGDAFSDQIASRVHA